MLNESFCIYKKINTTKLTIYKSCVYYIILNILYINSKVSKVSIKVLILNLLYKNI